MNRCNFEKLLAEAREDLEKNARIFSSVFKEKIVKYFLRFGDRCVLFKIFSQDGRQMCKIVAGEPIDKHNIGLTEPLYLHPDIKAATLGKAPLFIKEPEKCEETKYLGSIIRQYDISQFLYVPVLLSGEEAKEETKWVAVIDACGQKEFALVDIDFCLLLEELFSFCLWKESKHYGSSNWDNFCNRRLMNGIDSSSIRKQILVV